MTIQWTGNGATNSWNNAGNWSGDMVPYSYDSVTIGSVGSLITVAIPSLSTPRAGSLTIGNGGNSETVQLNLAGAFTLNGGTLAVVSGAGLITRNGAIDLNGGDLSVASGASYSERGGTLSINALTVDGTMTLSGVVTVASQSISGSGMIDVNGGTLGSSSDLLTVSSGTPGFRIENGGTLALRNAGSVSSIAFGSGANGLFVQGNAGSITTSITGFASGDSIVIEEGDITSETATRNSDGSYTISLYQNPYYAAVVFTHVSLGSGVAASQIAFKVSGNETIVTIACFLTGTRIATDQGNIAIEQLSPGDQVVTLEGGERVLRSIRWLGRRDIDLTGLDEQAARDAAPIRIHAHAFAANIPARDLLVTPEHCIFVDGGLIPARMLVNGASIVQDRSLLRFTVHHLECERHAILLSDGLTTESYLDTGNREGFGATDPAHHQATQASASWSTDAAAPLTTQRAVVEPIWRRLLVRAEQLGLVAPKPAAAISTSPTRDPALRLRLDDGTVLRARSRNGERHFFVLPAGTERAILLSRSAVPAEVEGPFVDDRRRLGVLVQSATLWMELRNAAIPLAASWLQGWHPAEHPGQPEWTDGEAEITFDAVSQSTILEVTLAGMAP